MVVVTIRHRRVTMASFAIPETWGEQGMSLLPIYV